MNWRCITIKKLEKLELEKQYDEEAALLRDAKVWLEVQPDILVMRINDRYAKGYSDIFLCVGGIFVVIELKDNTGKAAPHQINFIRQVKQKGGLGGVCRTLKEIVDYVEEARRLCMRLMT